MKTAKAWFNRKGWTPHDFQLLAWKAMQNGESGLVNAPTGSGKTYSLGMPIIERAAAHRQKRLQVLWVVPIRALAKEIHQALERANTEIQAELSIAIRTGDTSSSARKKMKKDPPHILITTPESIHILLASKGYARFFRNLSTVVVDEWHEFMGSKRGVLVELFLARFKTLNPNLKVWGISATIGNMRQAMQVLHGASWRKARLIKSSFKKHIDVRTILPEQIETMPWAGHLGIKLLPQVIPIILESKSTLLFTNTRSQCEIWYQRLLETAPELAGLLAMHHGSIDKKLRHWVEDALYQGELKAVVCTSSLDLGVDFRPVESIIQIGSPKGIARFMQRAGRSNHRPGETSTIYFVPTHALEILEGAALREGVEQQAVEDRIPYLRSFDVLLQYLCTLAVSDGFQAPQLLAELRTTFSYKSVSEEEWQWLLHFLTEGGESLSAYNDFHKVVQDDEGWFRITSRRIAMRHRLSIGTIVSDPAVTVKYKSGKRIGTIEEWFVSRLRPGDVFWFAGRALRLERFKENTAYVSRSKSKQGKVPSWQGGRMPLSSQLSSVLRKQYQNTSRSKHKEVRALAPLFALQKERSAIPGAHELLVEYFKSREGYHLVFYPFEGRLVHEGLASLLAYRMAQHIPISFTMAMNDYSFELLSATQIEVENALALDLFTTENLVNDIYASVNAAELARRKFRDIATIGGLVFTGYPGKGKKDRHLQASAQTFFDVFHRFEQGNLLYQQAFQETLEFQLEEQRLRQALKRMQSQTIVLTQPSKPTPFAFPVMVDQLREKLSTEKLETRIERMIAAYGK